METLTTVNKATAWAKLYCTFQQEQEVVLQFGIHILQFPSLQFCMLHWSWCIFIEDTNMKLQR